MQPKAKKGPTKPRNSWLLFSKVQRKSAEIAQLSFADANKAINQKYRTAARTRLERAEQRLTTYSRAPHRVACRWKAVSAEEKAIYDGMAKEDKARYQRELAAFEAEHGVLELQPKQPKKNKAADTPEVRPNTPSPNR